MWLHAPLSASAWKGLLPTPTLSHPSLPPESATWHRVQPETCLLCENTSLVSGGPSPLHFPFSGLLLLGAQLYNWAHSFHKYNIQFSSAQLLSRVRLFATPWIAAHQASLSITNSWSLLKLMPIELVMPSSHLILYRPLLLLSPIPSNIRVFSSESALRMSWPKYWSFSFSISPSNEHPGLISFRMDWLDLLLPPISCLLALFSRTDGKLLKEHYSPSLKRTFPV